MLIRPTKNLNTDINSLHNFEYAKRNIIIFNVDNSGFYDDNIIEYPVLIINNSLQNGCVGGHLTNKESLFSNNMYYGFINKSFITFNKGKVKITPGAYIEFSKYSYTFRLEDKIKESRKESLTSYGEYEYNMSLSTFYSKKDILMPSPEFYTYDQQIITNDDEESFLSVKLYDNFPCNIHKKLINFDSIVDKNTDIYMITTQNDMYSSFKINNENLNAINNSNILFHITNTVGNIIRLSAEFLLSNYTFIIDSELGFNLLDPKFAHNIDNRSKKIAISSIYSQLEEERIKFLDLDYTIRIECVYRQQRTYIRIVQPNEFNVKLNTDNSADIVDYLILESIIA